MESWQELANPRDLTKIFRPRNTPPGARCGKGRLRYIGLGMPRFLARLPTARRPSRSRNSISRKTAEGADTASTAGPMPPMRWRTNINAAFKMYGWCTRIRGIESGGAVEGLPAFTFPTDDGGVDMKCPTEIAISDRREAELAKNGFMPLIHRKNTDFAAFIGAQSLQKPAEYEDPAATANANLSARLPYLFASCRFAHYLKCMVRDKIGSTMSREQLQAWLTRWVIQYVGPTEHRGVQGVAPAFGCVRRARRKSRRTLAITAPSSSSSRTISSKG